MSVDVAVDAGAAVRRLRAIGRGLGPGMRRATLRVADDAVVEYLRQQPSDSGDLARGTRVYLAGDAVEVRAHARSDKGYDYVGVTRKGHRPAGGGGTYGIGYIYPVRFSALWIPKWGRWVARVSRYRPASDWAEDAIPVIRRHAERELDDLSRSL